MLFEVLPVMHCVMVCKVKKPKVHAKESYSLPQKTLLLLCLNHLVWSRAFPTLACVHHYVTGVI